MGVTSEETATWRDAADAVNIPYDEELGVHQQCEGFTKFAEWDFVNDNKYPLLLHEAYVRLYPAQVIKQADLVLAMQWQSHAFTPEQKARNVDYYERRMVRDSSLSACTSGGDVRRGRASRAGPRLRLRGRPDRPARPALTTPATACTWPRSPAPGRRSSEASAACATTRASWPSILNCPTALSRLRFRLRWRDFRVTVDANHPDVTYTVRDGPGGELTIRHAGEERDAEHRRRRPPSRFVPARRCCRHRPSRPGASPCTGVHSDVPNRATKPGPAAGCRTVAIRLHSRLVN